jgi:hypothetical protein
MNSAVSVISRCISTTRWSRASSGAGESCVSTIRKRGCPKSDLESQKRGSAEEAIEHLKFYPEFQGA